jgi:hypothetical protein
MRINSDGVLTMGGVAYSTNPAVKMAIHGIISEVNTSNGTLNNPVTNGGYIYGDTTTGRFAGTRFLNELLATDRLSMNFFTYPSGGPATERMIILHTGDVGIGTSIPLSSSRLSVNKINDPCIGLQRGGTDGTIVIFGRASDGTTVGSISTTSSSTAYNTSSDYRLKENINYNFDAITRLKKLKPARFNFINGTQTVDGFLAHEVSDIVPEAIHGIKDQVEVIGNITDDKGNIIQENVKELNELPENQTWTQTGTRPVYQGIDQSKLVPLLTGALQEAIAKIESLEARLTALESK